MSVETIVQALGGLALFLFAMHRMTEGLTVFAGSGLKRLLGRWTSTPLRGVFACTLVTGLVPLRRRHVHQHGREGRLAGA